MLYASELTRVRGAFDAIVEEDIEDVPDLIARLLTNAGFTTKGLTQPLEAQLAETVPTIDNGLWKVAPDGRMEMTWKIRAG